MQIPLVRKKLLKTSLSGDCYLNIHIDNFDKGATDLNIISIEDFLQNLSLTHDEYIIALRSGLKRPTLFLQRNMNELRINTHNLTVLYLWKANMDLQYILDPYACVVYVVSYIGKAQRGMSKLLKVALLHYKAGDTTIKERLWGIANKFQNCIEVFAHPSPKSSSVYV